MQNKDFDFDECKQLILEGILHSLKTRREDILAFPETGKGLSKICGMSLDIFPWHNLIQISFCAGGDDFAPRSVPEWTYFDFISSYDEKYERLIRASDYISSFWNGDFDPDGEELEEYFIDRELKANVIFWAGAEAILEPKVTELLVNCGINIWLPNRFFIVANDDDPNDNNYCEIIKAFVNLKLFFNELGKAKSFE